MVDASVLGTDVHDVQVQVLSPAPNSRNPNPKPVGEGFGFLLYIEDSPKISRIPKNSLGQ